jgi:hypothetical protein
MLIDLNPLIDQIGRAAYEAFCAEARRFAPGQGTRFIVEEEFDSQLAHDLCSYIWDAPSVTPADKVETMLALYEQMPCYAVLMYVVMNLGDCDLKGRQLVWAAYRRWLEGSDVALSDPAFYSLGVDIFEGQDWVDEAWQALVIPASTDRLIAWGLQDPGAVPWRLKAPLYERLRAEERWHDAIFESLWRSSPDDSDGLDVAEARLLLDQLHLPPSSDLDTLRADLAKP